MKSPLFSLLAFALLQGLIHFGVFMAIDWAFKPVIVVLYLYMVGLSLVFERILVKEPNPKRFVNYYMGFSGGKLMLSLFILVGYAFFNRDYVVPFAVSFLVVYFSFTILEIVRLLRHLKNS